MGKSGCAFVSDKVTWRIGGLRSASVGSAWIPSEGRTGFYRGKRLIEEPNHLSRTFRKYFSQGLKAKVGAHEDELLDHDSVIDAILQYSDVVPNPFVVNFFVSGQELRPSHWFVLSPKGRLTSRESWVVKSDVDLLDSPGMILADD